MASSPAGPGWWSRVRGCLPLAACVDALGARFEGITRVEPAEVDHHLASRIGSLRWTDGPGPDPRRTDGQQEASVVPWTATS